MSDFLKKLSQAYGPSADESAVTKLITDEIKPYVDEMSVDKIGNLLAVKKNGGKRIFVATAVDQPCFMVTHIEENGRLKFSIEGFPDMRSVANAEIVFKNGTRGVITCEQDELTADWRNYYIDIGSKSREEAASHADIGSVGVISGDYHEDENYVYGPALHKRAACVCLVDIIKKLADCKNGDFYFGFTTHSLMGSRGSRVSAGLAQPQIAVGIDHSQSGDGFVETGKGPVLRMRDKSMTSDPKIVAKLLKTAEKNGMNVQKEVSNADFSTMTGVLQNGFDLKAASVSLPVGNIFGKSETVSKSDVAKLSALVAETVSQF